jgi:outer membrane protein OmpA-like peptidoglycan-associated protein
VGDDKNNQILSENRAKSVYNYLLSNGIASNRISFKGYGNTQPIASNNTEEGRQTNRRTEIQIIGF